MHVACMMSKDYSYHRAYLAVQNASGISGTRHTRLEER